MRFQSEDYFTCAKSWADDIYTNAIISRDRYKVAFYFVLGLATLLSLAINGLIPLQHLEPLLIEHYQDGRVTVQPFKQPYKPEDMAQTESELIRYLVHRESYDPTSYRQQYALVNLLSSPVVAQEYITEQSANNRLAPIKVLGKNGYRTVHIDSIVFLDSKEKNLKINQHTQQSINLAEVNFTITDRVQDSASQKSQAFTALLSWDYLGVPKDPEIRWQNWDGFVVTRYTVTQRNIQKAEEAT